MSDYETQLKEANQKLREQIDIENNRALMIEGKLRELALKSSDQTNITDELVRVQPMSFDHSNDFFDFYTEMHKNR